MSSIKTYNSNTGKWEVRGASHANSIGVIDIPDNYQSDSIEGCLREIADAKNTLDSKIDAARYTSASNKLLIDGLQSDFHEHVTNHPGGGGGSSSNCKITSVFAGGIIDPEKDLEIPIFFTSDNRGNGTVFIKINNIEIDMRIIPQGSSVINLGRIETIESDLEIYVKDAKGMMSNLLYWKIIKGGIEFTIDFNFEQDYSVAETIKMRYTIKTPITDPLTLQITYKGKLVEVPIESGSGEKIFKGSELGVGVHNAKLRVVSGDFRSPQYDVNLAIVSSYELYLSSTFESGEFEYGSAIIIPYRISKISKEEFDVKRIINGGEPELLKSRVGNYSWTIPTIANNLKPGQHTFRIEVTGVTGDSAYLEFTATVVQGSYTPIEVEKTGLIAWFDANDMTNQDLNKDVWKDRSGRSVLAKLVNFNYQTNGWMEQKDEQGKVIDRMLTCDNEAYVEIDMKPFETNALYGLTIECLYRSNNIGYEEARILDCSEIVGRNEDGSAVYKGAFIDVVSASMLSDSQVAKVTLNENSEIRITYVLDRYEKFCKVYIDGVMCRAFYLKDSVNGGDREYENFQHAQKIYLNSEKGLSKFGACDIKSVRIYDMPLDADQVLKNHLADIRDMKVQKDKYDFNFNKDVDKTPVMVLYGTKEEFARMNGDQEVTLRVEYRSPSPDMFGESFDYGKCSVKWQGTSSLEYVKKNYTIFLKDDSFTDMFYTPFKDGIPENVYCLKADYIESSHANNLGMAKFIHDNLYEQITPAQQVNRNYRTTIDGFPILLYANYLDGKENTLIGAYNFNLDRYSTYSYGYEDENLKSNILAYEIAANSDFTAGAFVEWTPSSGKGELEYYADSFKLIYPPSRKGNDNYEEIKSLVRWVSSASEELFTDNIDQHFNVEYLLRYYLMVMIMGGVDSLGKNIKLVSYDGGKIWYPQFYDMDTILGLNNTGFLVHDSDIEVEEGIFMTTGSKLWYKVRTYMQRELRAEYINLRKIVTEDSLLKYFYGEQISRIPERNYNIDTQSKYLDFGPLYLNVCHGNRLHHMRKWIRERIVYVDTLMGYTGELADTITLRANKPGNVSLWLETYIPMYLTVKWRSVPDEIIGGQIVNRGKTTIRVGRNQKVEFKGMIDTATHHEVLIYAGRYLKSIDGLSELRPSELKFAAATKLTRLECHSDKLIETQVSNMVNLQYVNLSGSKIYGDSLATEGGQKLLDLKKCRYLKKIDISDTALTAIDLNINGGSVEEIIYSSAVQSVVLTNQPRLKRIGIPIGYRSLLRSSIPIANKKYDYYLTPEEIESDPNAKPLLTNPIITDSDEHLTFTTPIKVTGSMLYKIRMNKSGGDIIIHEFNAIGEKVDEMLISMASASTVDYTPDDGVEQIIVVLDSNKIWTISEMESCRLALEVDINVNDEASALQTFTLTNCKNVSSLSQYDYPKLQYEFQPIKYVQNLTISNSLNMTEMNFNDFSKLRLLDLNGLSELVKIGFNDMNNVGDTSELSSVTIANCPKIETIEMNVTNANKAVIFAEGGTIDLGSLYTLNRIESNTPIIGLETIIVNRDIEDIILGKSYSQSWDGNVKNIWSYETAVDNKESGYEGIDFANLKVKNIDLSGSKRIVGNKNLNLYPTNTFIINQVRDNVIYPFMDFNGTIDLTDYVGSYVGLFKNSNLTNVNLICNKDIVQTDFTSLFEGATIGNCNISNLLLRIKTATSCSKMFANSDVKTTSYMEQITFSLNADISYMFEGCNIPSTTKLTLPNRVSDISGLFKNTPITSLPFDSIPDSVIKINELFSGTNLRSLNNFTVGSGVIESLNWTLNAPIESADNMTIRIVTVNNTVRLNNIPTLITANNLNLPGCASLSEMFSGDKNLTEYSIIQTDMQQCTSLYKTFEHCEKLTRIDLSQLSFSYRLSNISNIFDYCYKLIDIIMPPTMNLGTYTTISGGFRAILNPFKLTNYKIGKNVTSVSWLFNTVDGPVKVEELNNFECGSEILAYSPDPSKIMFTGNQYLKRINDITFGERCTIFTGAFKDCINLQSDISLHYYAANVVDMFNGCRSITSIHSNWKKSYFLGSIQSNNCYLGCDSVTTCDDVPCEGLDVVPESWGGYGFTYDQTNIAIFDVSMISDYTLVLPGNPALTDWGDGTITRDVLYHNYSRPGKYKVKSKSTMFEGKPGQSIISSLLEVINVKPAYNNTGWSSYSNLFYNCVNLTKVTISGLYNMNNPSSMFYGCSSLKDVSITNCKFTKSGGVPPNISDMFRGCSSIEIVDLTGIDFEAGRNDFQSLSGLFYGCSNLKSIYFPPNGFKYSVAAINISSMLSSCTSLDISSVNFDNILNMANVEVITGLYHNTRAEVYDVTPFSKCLNLKSFSALFKNCINAKTFIGLDQINTSRLTSMYEMFYGCTSLIELDLSSFNTSQVKETRGLCADCSSLQTINMAGLSFPIPMSNWQCGEMFGGTYSLTHNPFVGIVDASGFSSIGYACSRSVVVQDFANVNNLNFESFWFPEHVQEIKNLHSKRAWETSFNQKGNIMSFDYIFPKKTGTLSWFYYGWNHPNQRLIFEGDITVECNINTVLSTWTTGMDVCNMAVAESITVESLISLLNALHDYSKTPNPQAILKLQSRTMAKLTPQQLSIATNKGWTVTTP